MNSRFKPPSILASWLVNTRAFSVFMIVVLVMNAVIIGIDVECTLRWPNSLGWLHLAVDVISITGESTSDFLDQKLISYRYSSCCCCCCCCWGVPSSKNAWGSVVSNRIGMKFGRIVQISTHRWTESDFCHDVTISGWRSSSWRHFTRKTAATWWMHTQHVPRAYFGAMLFKKDQGAPSFHFKLDQDEVCCSFFK